MKWLIYFILITTIFTGTTTAAEISLSDSVINFGMVETNIAHTEILTINNLSDAPIELSGIVFEESEFGAEYVSNQIAGHSSIQVSVEFNGIQNIDYTDFMRIMIEDCDHPLIVKVTAQAAYNDDYYDLSRNKWDEELKSALYDIVKDHTSLGYTIGRDYMYGSIDNENGWVECVYTGRTAQFDTRAGATSNNFNCEHTWPQSFFNENEPMRSDLFHLYPTDIEANSQRGNNDFGIVQNTTWTEGGSKAGSDSDGLIVFEPRDVHKGNVARTYFYFIVRYSGQYVGFQDAEKMENHFRTWNVSDPVDSKEEQRNEAIFALQNNRNPFIDHPEFADRIIRFYGTENRNPEPEIALSTDRIELHNLNSSNDIQFTLGIINTGKGELAISQIISSNPNFHSASSGLTIDPESYKKITLSYSPSGEDILDSTTFQISSNDTNESIFELPVVLHFLTTSVLNNNNVVINEFKLFQNYPNPFNPRTVINYNLSVPGDVELIIYNTSGQRVATLINEFQSQGNHQIVWNAENQPSGIYFARLKSNNNIATQRMVLIR